MAVKIESITAQKAQVEQRLSSGFVHGSKCPNIELASLTRTLLSLFPLCVSSEPEFVNVS
jgi:hypothetical protein